MFDWWDGLLAKVSLAAITILFPIAGAFAVVGAVIELVMGLTWALFLVALGIALIAVGAFAGFGLKAMMKRH